MKPKLTIKYLLVVTMMLAVAFGWFVSLMDYQNTLNRRDKIIRSQEKQIQYYEAELDRVRDAERHRSNFKKSADRAFSGGDLVGSRLADVMIKSNDNLFIRATFRDADLQRATLTGGASSFQRAVFDSANMVNAKLNGGTSSFQFATFVRTDLSSAVLNGGASSFQLASFEEAILNDAVLIGSFQMVNLSGAHFDGADLSALNASDLSSCYFRDAPQYDDKTTFPSGFDPVEEGWRRRE